MVLAQRGSDDARTQNHIDPAIAEAVHQLELMAVRHAREAYQSGLKAGLEALRPYQDGFEAGYRAALAELSRLSEAERAQVGEGQ